MKKLLVLVISFISIVGGSIFFLQDKEEKIKLKNINSEEKMGNDVTEKLKVKVNEAAFEENIIEVVKEINLEKDDTNKKVEVKEVETKSTEKNNSSASNTSKKENITKQDSNSISNNVNISNTTPNIPQNNQSNNQQVLQPQMNDNEQKNIISTSFYDSITGGKKERKSDGTPMTESEVLARGEEIVDKEQDYVLDWNEEHPDNKIKSDINYFRIYPVIDDEGTGYYLHFFCISGEGNDEKLKAMF